MLKIYDSLHDFGPMPSFGPADQPVRLRYYASELLLRLGLENDPEMRDEVVRRTMRICHAAGISINQNFRQVYVYFDSEVETDWILSSLAAILFLLNGDPQNPFVARAQLTLLMKMKHGEEYFSG